MKPFANKKIVASAIGKAPAQYIGIHMAYIGNAFVELGGTDIVNWGVG